MSKSEMGSVLVSEEAPARAAKGRRPASSPARRRTTRVDWKAVEELASVVFSLLKPLNLPALLVVLLAVGPSIKVAAEVLQFPPDWKAAAQFLIPAVALAAWSAGRGWVAYCQGRSATAAEEASWDRSAKLGLDPDATELAAAVAVAKAEQRPGAGLLVVPFVAIAMSVLSFIGYLSLHTCCVISNDDGKLFVLPYKYYPETLLELKARKGLAYVIDNDTTWLTDQLKTVEALHVAGSNSLLLLFGTVTISSLMFGTTALKGARKAQIKADDVCSAAAKALHL
jgi:hypothetical protein